jgi:hypothetical protein
MFDVRRSMFDRLLHSAFCLGFFILHSAFCIRSGVTLLALCWRFVGALGWLQGGLRVALVWL